MAPSPLDADLATQVGDLENEYSAHVSQKLQPSVLETVACLGLVKVAAHFEQFLEGCFFESMLGNHPDPDVAPTIAVASRRDVELLIYSDFRRERYLDWLPWERTKARANAYLVDGRPFDRLAFRDVEARALTSLAIVRNAIAHPGAYAEALFIKHLKDRGVTSNSPGDFLLRARSGRSEYEHYLMRIKSLGRALAAPSEVDAAQFLEPELPFSSKTEGPPGEYECRACGYKLSVSVRAQIGDCPNCPAPTPCPQCLRPLGGPKTSWTRILL